MFQYLQGSPEVGGHPD